MSIEIRFLVISAVVNAHIRFEIETLLEFSFQEKLERNATKEMFDVGEE